MKNKRNSPSKRLKPNTSPKRLNPKISTTRLNTKNRSEKKTKQKNHLDLDKIKEKTKKINGTNEREQ